MSSPTKCHLLSQFVFQGLMSPINSISVVFGRHICAWTTTLPICHESTFTNLLLHQCKRITFLFKLQCASVGKMEPEKKCNWRRAELIKKWEDALWRSQLAVDVCHKWVLINQLSQGMSRRLAQQSAQSACLMRGSWQERRTHKQKIKRWQWSRKCVP